jgi:hypothetical protein
MKALIAVVIACIVAAAVVVVMMLRGPAWAWWSNPAALTVLAGTVVCLVAVLVPRGWWQRSDPS